MKALITSLGSAGDIHPFVAIGRELAARGVDVTMLVNPHFEPTVRHAGLGFLPLGEEFDFKQKMAVPNAAHHRKGAITVLRELLIADAPTIIAATQDALARAKPDVVVAHHISIGASWLCERHHIPLVTCVLAPACWFNDRDRCVYTSSVPENLPRWARRASMWLARRQMRWLYDRPVNRIRRDLGFPPARDMLFRDATAGDVVLGLWDPVFRGPLDGDPPTGLICGFPWHDESPRLDTDSAALFDFLDECDRANDPPVLFSLGTAIVHVAGDFCRHAAQACRALGRRGILLTNRPEYAPDPSELPPGVRTFNYAPFSRVMPRCAASVHHGGIGTTAQGLRSGRPTLIVPHAYDQFDNAARARRLGVSQTLWATKVTPARLTQAVRNVLTDAAMAARAREVGSVIGRGRGAETPTTAILNFMKHPSASPQPSVPARG